MTMKSLKIILLASSVATMPPALAQDAAPTQIGRSEAAMRIIDQGRLACSKEKGQFNAASDAVMKFDLNGDGKPDEIVDEGKFACSTAASLYCGTGGCGLHLIVDGKDHNYLSQVWSVASLGEAKIILFGVHWSACKYKSPCVRGVVWRDGKFRYLS
jgi:hypothetical protein